MFAILRRGALALALGAVSAGVAAGGEVQAPDVRLAMLRVEALLAGIGIDVAGYALSDPPAVQYAPARHPYLQGNDGGFVPGRIYINEDAVEDCRDLTLIHELVHDASVKFGLFAGAPNDRVRDLFEALADAVTAEAAEVPYRPGCLPTRRFEVSSLDLPVLARATAAP